MKSADLSDRPGRAAPPRAALCGAFFCACVFGRLRFLRLCFCGCIVAAVFLRLRAGFRISGARAHAGSSLARAGAGWCGPGQVSAGPVQKNPLNRSQITFAREERTRFYSLMFFISTLKNKTALFQREFTFFSPGLPAESQENSLSGIISAKLRRKSCPLYSCGSDFA